MFNHDRIVIGTKGLEGELCTIEPALGLVVFAHGSGSSRKSRRNVQVAQTLQGRGLGTLLFDLLTPDEADDRSRVFDIPLGETSHPHAASLAQPLPSLDR